jgi:hypothetical protein
MRVGPGPRARPVAEAPVDALLARADELARAWAIALILARPLEQIGELPLESLAREAPALCAQAIRALASDAELERMAGRGAAGGREDAASARRLGALAGVRDAESAVEAVEALRGVLWEALLDELGWPSFDRSPARQVADLGDRLACVCATALAATIDAAVAADPPEPVDDADFAVAGSAPGVSGSDRAPVGLRGGVLIDERREVAAAPRPASAPRAPGSSEARQTQARPLPWEPSPSEPREPHQAVQGPTRPFPKAAVSPPAEESQIRGVPARDESAVPQATAEPQIEIRDERGEEGPAAWIGSIGRWLERFEEDGLPFAVLLVEVFDVERLGRVVLPEELSALTSRVEGALVEELRAIGGTRWGAQPAGPGRPAGLARPAGSFTRERPGRYWLLAPETDGIAVRMLAGRLVRALRPLARRRGVALPFAVGMAVCPEDGRDAAALAAHADVGLYDARSTGRPLASVDKPL